MVLGKIGAQKTRNPRNKFGHHAGTAPVRMEPLVLRRGRHRPMGQHVVGRRVSDERPESNIHLFDGPCTSGYHPLAV